MSRGHLVLFVLFGLVLGGILLLGGDADTPVPRDTALLDGKASAAVITAAAALIVWLLTQFRGMIEARDARRNAQMAIARVLKAEIAVNNAARQRSARSFDDAIKMLREKPDYQPYVSVEAEKNPIFEQYLSELSRLPEEVVGPVVDYYKHDGFLNSVMQDMTTSRFAGLESERKIRLLTYLNSELIKPYDEKANDAIRHLDAFIQSRKRSLW